MADPNQELLMMREELKEMREWRSQMNEFLGRQPKQSANTQDDEMVEEDVLDDSVEIGWVNHLKGAQAKPTTPGATSLASLLAIPPPLDLIAKQVREATQYQGVPQTPAARQHRVDQKLFQTQKKLEMLMHCMVHEEEKRDHSEAEVIAALARSAWEDLQQQRRSLIAGRQMSKLDIREDDSRARLLSKEEEEKVAKGRAARAQQQFRATPDWRNTSQTGFAKPYYNKWQPASKQGKGKGKGKGKGNNSF